MLCNEIRNALPHKHLRTVSAQDSAIRTRCAISENIYDKYTVCAAV